jgi:hypothetical protein
MYKSEILRVSVLAWKSLLDVWAKEVAVIAMDLALQRLASLRSD